MRSNDVADLYAALDRDFPRDENGRSIGLMDVLRDLSDALREAGDDSAADCIAWCWANGKEPTHPGEVDMPSWDWWRNGNQCNPPIPNRACVPEIMYLWGRGVAASHTRRLHCYEELVRAWGMLGLALDKSLCDYFASVSTVPV